MAPDPTVAPPRWKGLRMKHVRKLMIREVVSSISLVTVAFLALFYFLNLGDDMENVGKGAYRFHHAALYTLLQVPSRLYELLPICVLIGAIRALAGLAESSEFTILRTSGLGPGRALKLLMQLGLALAVLAWATGDIIAPWAQRMAQQVKADASPQFVSQRGAWLKDRQTTLDAQGRATERLFTINVQVARADGRLEGVRLFEYDSAGRLTSRVIAATGQVRSDAQWELHDAERTRWTIAPQGGVLREVEERVPQLLWRSSLSPKVVSSALLYPETMNTLELWQYVRHLAQNEQTAQRYEISFWRRATYPLTCVVMLMLALPFAYLHGRAGGVSLKVFGGIMLGVSFLLLNELSNSLGLLQNWRPWIAATVPSSIFLLLSLIAFGWLVQRR